jgi:myo-inositol 2-dehydrogenase/D-chiro-inositol 1-dehydrogenase
MRFGLIGLGRMGAFHAETLHSLPAVTSLVVYDPSSAATAAIVDRLGTDRLGVEPAPTAAQVLSAGIDALVIAAATDAHPELLRRAIDAHIPVFCEKPVAREPADSLEIERRAANTGVPVQIGYPRRFDTAFMAAHKAVVGGELGWLHTVRSTTLDPAPAPDAYIRSSGGIFRDCSVHDFDAVRFVTGQEVVEVYATGSNQGAAVFAESGDVDSAATILTLESGALAVVSNSRYNARGYDVRLEVHGSKDSVVAGLDQSLPLRSLEPGASFPTAHPHNFFMERFGAAFRAELAAFAEVAAGTRLSPCTMADAVEVGWIAEAATLSLAQHRPVPMKEIRP